MPCHICFNTYQITHHLKCKATCCGKSICGDCFAEIHQHTRGNCPFCRASPLDTRPPSVDEPETSGSDDSIGDQVAGDAMKAAKARQSALAPQAERHRQLAASAASSSRNARFGEIFHDDDWLDLLDGFAAFSSDDSDTVGERGDRSGLTHASNRHGQVDRRAVRAQDVKLPQKINHKTQMCEFWMRGKCSRGKACTYAHGKHQLRAESRTSVSDRTDLPARRTVRPGAAHQAESMLSFYSPTGPKRRALNSKTKLCEHFELKGYCPHKTRCTFAHGEAELQDKVQQVEPAIIAFIRGQALVSEGAGCNRLDAWRKELQELKTSGGGFAFPGDLNAAERKAVHLLCDELGLRHVSKGEGAQRRLHVRAPQRREQGPKLSSKPLRAETTPSVAAFGKKSAFAALADDSEDDEEYS